MHPDTARRGAPALRGPGLPRARREAGRDAVRAAGLHAWLDTWHGLGLIEQGLARQDRDLSLTRYRDRWEAAVFVTGKEHAVVQGTGWQATPWDAV